MRRSWGLVETNRNDSSHSFTNVAPSALNWLHHAWHFANSPASSGLFNPWPDRLWGWPWQLLELGLVLQQFRAFYLSQSILMPCPNELSKGWNCPPDITAGMEGLGSNYPYAFCAHCPLKFQWKMLPVPGFWWFFFFFSSWCRTLLSPMRLPHTVVQTDLVPHQDTPCMSWSKQMASCIVERNTTYVVRPFQVLCFPFAFRMTIKPPSLWHGTVVQK